MGQLPFQISQPCTHNVLFLAEPLFRGDVSLANVLRACWACNTVPVTLELFNHKRQSRGLATAKGRKIVSQGVVTQKT
jgi:hypothetical protein